VWRVPDPQALGLDPTNNSCMGKRRSRFTSSPSEYLRFTACYYARVVGSN